MLFRSGAGLYAILFALRGHRVIGIDNNERMLEAARENCQAFGAEAEFVRGDVQSPPLRRRSADLIVSNNTVWNLTDPASAYGGWKELLAPGGAVVVIDGNYYLDIFDEEYGRRKAYMDLNGHGMNDGLHAKTNTDGVDFNIMRDLARGLPCSRRRRPAWDVSLLLGAGMTDVHVQSLDENPYSVLTEHGFVELPSLPKIGRASCRERV